MNDPPPEPRLSLEDEADLVALADGTLDPARAAELDARAAADPALAAALERQRVAVAAIGRAVEATSPPLGLRSQVERLSRKPPRARRRRMAWARPRGLGWLVPAGAAAAAALIVALALPLGGGVAVEDTLAAATRPAQTAATPDPHDANLLRESVDGVRFPNFEGKFDWRPVGVRSDRLDGRASRTVFYERDGERIAYTIVDGERLDWPDADVMVRDGVELRPFEEEGRNAVTWLREGQTCVLSGEGVDTATLLELAAWKGKGSVSF